MSFARARRAAQRASQDGHEYLVYRDNSGSDMGYGWILARHARAIADYKTIYSTSRGMMHGQR